MKTADKLEVIEEMLGSLPEAPEGKKLVGVKFKKPKLGEKFLCNENKWVTAVSNWQTFVQVAIFEDTHRADGTPMSISPLPKVSGYRVEYFGQHLSPEHMGNAVGYCIHFCGKWHTYKTCEEGEPSGSAQYYARIFKVEQPKAEFDGVTHSITYPPTTLVDLVGEDGQKSVWIFYTENSIHRAKVSSIHRAKVSINKTCGLAVDNWSIRALVGKGCRWSHSPFTPFKEANKFVV